MIQASPPSRAREKTQARRSPEKNGASAPGSSSSSDAPDPSGIAEASRLLLDSLNLAVAAFHAESGVLMYCNAAFKTAFARNQAASTVTYAAFEGAFFQRLMMDGDAPRISSANPGGASAGPFTSEEQDLLHRDSGRWYSGRAVNGVISFSPVVILHLADITDRLEAEHRKHSQRQQMLFTSKVMSVGEMAATLAHELNQPIGSLTNYLTGTLRYLDSHPDIDTAIVEPLRSAKKQAERAASIITRIRQFVRAREPKLSELSLEEVMADVLTLVEPESTKYGVRICLALPAGLPSVRADRVMVEQVIHNLVKNAIEAMTSPLQERKLITVTAKKAPSSLIEVSVEDSGHGLPVQASEQVFSPFFTTKADGLGIGLNICRSMIEYHGGSLFFKNNAHQSGSTFIFTLPEFASAGGN
jgi:signal transduction histidine kinase